MLWLADRDSWRGDVPRDISPSSPSASSFTFCHSCPSLAVSNGSGDVTFQLRAFQRRRHLSDQITLCCPPSWKVSQELLGGRKKRKRAPKHLTKGPQTQHDHEDP
ncbi:hypothetical protein Q7C36_000521 [Tachysurus vachellii]|uniref:Uncharacterized protein n=1 Tax=Tachysurus vachellii TaxID=175792 RepID=A0AA88P231_TACVA|nr:hypothetical protein Q7C36_000521 [Tachysurus vachellii]